MNKRCHEIVISLRFDKPVSSIEAIANAREYWLGESAYTPQETEAGAEHMEIYDIYPLSRVRKEG